MDPMTMMMLAQQFGPMLQGGGAGGGTDFGLGQFGAAAGSGLLGGYLGSRRAKKDKRRQQKRLNRALNTTEAIQGRGLQQREALTRQATAQQLKGYDVAKQEAARLGRESKQSAIDRGTQLGASATQNLASRGLGSTTVGANLQRGIASDTNRQISGVNEGLAGLYGNLAQGRAGVEAQGTQNLADLAGQQADLFSQLAQMRQLGGSTLGNFQFGLEGTPNGFETALPGMSQAFGQYMGSQQQGGMNPHMLQYLFGHGGAMASGRGRYDMQPGFVGPASPFG